MRGRKPTSLPRLPPVHAVDTYVTGEAHQHKRGRQRVTMPATPSGTLTVGRRHRRLGAAAPQTPSSPGPGATPRPTTADRYLGDDVDLGVDAEALLPALSRGADETGELVDALPPDFTPGAPHGDRRGELPPPPRLALAPRSTPPPSPGCWSCCSSTPANPQVILLTNDEDVEAWARLESITGALDSQAPTTSARRAGADRAARRRVTAGQPAGPLHRRQPPPLD